MSLEHDFLLFDKQSDGDWESLRLSKDPRAIHLHDDVVRYMSDTLNWIPTINPTKAERQTGLCMWGPTMINAEGSEIAQRVFEAWAALFAAGPELMQLTGSYVFAADNASAADGSFEHFTVKRENIVDVLQTLAWYARQVTQSGGRYCILHGGV